MFEKKCSLGSFSDLWINNGSHFETILNKKQQLSFTFAYNIQFTNFAETKNTLAHHFLLARWGEEGYNVRVKCG